MRSPLVLITLAVFLSFSAGERPANACIKYVENFDLFGAESRVLGGFVFRGRSAVSRVACARDCAAEKQCLSINYLEKEHRCELNNSTRIQSKENFTVLQGSFYMDVEKNTGLLTADGDQRAVVPLELASCKELLNASPGPQPSGVYTIHPHDGTMTGERLQVYCDMQSDGGGWIVFQSRSDGSVEFYRSWADYRAGFGDLSGEFWLGNDILRALTEARPAGIAWELRIDMEDWTGVSAWAGYTNFRITGSEYILKVDNFILESTAGDSLLKSHDRQPFSTPDRDNDNNFLSCCQLNGGAWWYNNCHDSNLNGVYQNDPLALYNQGIQWVSWKGNSYSLKKCTMKIREIN